MDVALVTYSGTPQLTDDDRLLSEELSSRGLFVAPVVWDDPDFDWSVPALCVLRETWDYHLRLPAFLAWLERAAGATRVLNSPALVRWNSHKSYLRELEEKGVAVVPTVWLSAGSSVDIDAILGRRNWEQVVIKPSVSADGFETMLFERGEVQAAQAHTDRVLASRDLMLQPFLRSVQAYGERSLIFIEGMFTHAARRSEPFMGDGIEYPSRPVEAAGEEIDFASGVLGTLPEVPLYARVDIAPDNEGTLRLMELELIEPSLFLQFSPEAVKRMADAIMRSLQKFRAKEA